MSEDNVHDTSLQDTERAEETKNKSAKDTANQKKPRNKHRLLKILSILVASILVVILLIAGWFGFVPGLSNILGARTPKDLNVRWTEADFESYKTKTSTTFYDFATAPENLDKPGKKTVFADPKTVDNLQLTQEEISAAINKLGWSWLPAKNVQVRLSANTVEVSGNLKLDHVEDFVNFIGGVGYSNEDVSKAADYGRKLVDGGSFYAKGAASVTNNQLAFNLQSIQIGRFTVPQDIASKVIFTGGSNGINNAKYLNAQSATVDSGVLNFTGTYPTTIYVKR